MKRLALLLASVGLASGCVVESTTCDPRSLTVTWAFTDSAGRSNLSCTDLGLSADIVDVSIYIDGYAAATNVACSDYSVTFTDPTTGAHDVEVDGFDAYGYLVTRDFLSVSVGSCGDTTADASPGEGLIEIIPNSCWSNGDALTYELWDATYGTSYLFSAVYPTSLAFGDYWCGGIGGGISFAVPYGYYDLTGIEERSDSVTVENSYCYTTYIDVLPPLSTPVTQYITWSGFSACF